MGSRVSAIIFSIVSTYLLSWKVNSVATVGTPQQPILFHCYDCHSGLNNDSNPFCPGHGTITPVEDRVQKVVTANCTAGQKCYIKESKKLHNSTIFRGCSKLFTWGLPDPLPDDGCYEWNGDNMCLCSTDRCNTQAIGNATGIAIDAHLATGINHPPVTNRGDQENITCYTCNSGKPGEENLACNAKGWVNPQTTWKVNCTGRCVTRTTILDPKVKAYRECSDTWWKFPRPFASDGCYQWNSDLICICNYDYCNAAPLGNATGISLDAHLTTGIVRPPVTNRGNEVNITCYICNSGKPKKENLGCTAEGWVNPQSVWKDNCTGRCITRFNFLTPEVDVYRSCSDVWYKFPQPFARDGCYKWYSDIVCICNYNYCNAAPLGASSKVWLDAHLVTRETDGTSSVRASWVLLMTSLHIVLYFRWIFIPV